MSRARIFSLIILVTCAFGSGRISAQTPTESQADPKLLELLNSPAREYTDEEIDELSREDNPFFDFIGDDEAEVDSLPQYTHLSFIKPSLFPREAFMPMVFDKVMNSYNELQRGQVLDLSKYRGKEVT